MTKQRALLLIEQVIAPGEGGPERLLPGGCVLTSGQEWEYRVQSLQERAGLAEREGALVASSMCALYRGRGDWRLWRRPIA